MCSPKRRMNDNTLRWRNRLYLLSLRLSPKNVPASMLPSAVTLQKSWVIPVCFGGWCYLLENAHRHGGGSPVEVALTLPDSRHVELAVCDRVGGVLEAEQERIFEPFFRARGTREDDGGVGLGLSPWCVGSRGSPINWLPCGARHPLCAHTVGRPATPRAQAVRRHLPDSSSANSAAGFVNA